MGRKCILVVDDRGTLLAAVREILEMEGYTVLVALDGMQALQVMEEVRPDLIVADILMPRMDGYTLYERIRARSEWVSIPFIFLTARAGKEDIAKGRDLGVEGYITKPFDPDALLEAIKAQLEMLAPDDESPG